ncbi:MAG: bacillithiol biosynthesis deacetylase BshB1 [Flavobacteriales bacterium]|nr:bacillithiol biosynthesis deacetylase BshB1 [Flavobacteriales bacterium]
MKIDVLAFAAHPDDAELACAGTLLKMKEGGNSTGIIDLTAGELGTRGTPEIRREEARASAEILGLDVRECLHLPDGFFGEDEPSIRKVIGAIRAYQPSVILANAPSDRHPDHGRGGDLVRRAAFLSGLRRIETERNGIAQEPWRPKALFHYIQFRYHKPDFVVDITPYMDGKMLAIQAFKSQFHDPDSNEPETLIASKNFLNYVEARSREMGGAIEKEFGEGFLAERTLEVRDLFDLI